MLLHTFKKVFYKKRYNSLLYCQRFIIYLCSLSFYSTTGTAQSRHFGTMVHVFIYKKNVHGNGELINIIVLSSKTIVQETILSSFCRYLDENNDTSSLFRTFIPLYCLTKRYDVLCSHYDKSSVFFEWCSVFDFIMQE